MGSANTLQPKDSSWCQCFSIKGVHEEHIYYNFNEILIQALYMNKSLQSAMLFVNIEYDVWNLNIFLRKHFHKYQNGYENQMQKYTKDMKTAMLVF